MSWLNIRANASGLPGVLLEENNTRYHITHEIPPLLMVLGSTQKDLFLKTTWPHATRVASHGQVKLTHYDDSTLLVDCTLPSKLPKAQGGPNPEHISRHCLESLHGTSSEVTHKIYAKLIYPFISSFALFADDYGGPDAAADALASWISSSTPPKLPPHLVVITNTMIPTKAFIAMVRSRALQLGAHAPLQPSEAEIWLKLFFTNITLIRPSDYRHTPRESGIPRLNGLQFGQLFKRSIDKLKANEEFDLLSAWRQIYPSSSAASSHISQVCAAASNRGIDPMGLVSSSLLSDALLQRRYCQNVPLSTRLNTL
ncbi:hypothetical protein CKAH01_11546 [Colletotrichum kahawae]|uniref:Uncharacterized protein n=1 Tax=Colletotrichum kahawae TaxID=34407 RepID=A0AAD9YXR9_COLKA|nr:hypothetical protein CKAH01_11546 [Colletotrichum kahawae]